MHCSKNKLLLKKTNKRKAYKKKKKIKIFYVRKHQNAESD